MLSDVSIQKYLNSKDIIITPWDEVMLRSSGVTLHLGAAILIPQPGIVDVKNHIVPEYKKLNMTDNSPFPLEPNMFVLGETKEEIGLSFFY